MTHALLYDSHELKLFARDLFGRYMANFHAKVPADYLLNHLVGSFTETVKWWITGKQEYSPEEVAGFYMAVIEEIVGRDIRFYAVIKPNKGIF